MCKIHLLSRNRTAPVLPLFGCGKFYIMLIIIKTITPRDCALKRIILLAKLIAVLPDPSLSTSSLPPHPRPSPHLPHQHHLLLLLLVHLLVININIITSSSTSSPTASTSSLSPPLSPSPPPPHHRYSQYHQINHHFQS